MAKKSSVAGFHSSLLSLNMNGTTNRTLLVLVVLAALAVVGNVQGGAVNSIDVDPLRNVLIGLGLFAAGFMVYDYLFVRLSQRYPVVLGLDKLMLFGVEGLFVIMLTMTGVMTWVAADTQVLSGTLLSSAALMSIVAVAMLPIRYGLGAIAADKGWVRRPKAAVKAKAKRRR